MLDQIEAAILSTLQTIFDQFGWAGVFGLMAFENATGITPSEVILAFAGWMLIERHGITPTFILLGGVYAGLGSTLGSSILYWAARLGRRPVIEKFATLFRIDISLIDKVEEQMQKKGTGLILIGRLVPGIRTLISIPAGLIRISFPKFFVATLIGTTIWCTLIIGAGYLLGQEWILVSKFIKQHLPLVLSLGAFGMVIYLAYQYRSRLPAFNWIYVRTNKDEMENEL